MRKKGWYKKAKKKWYKERLYSFTIRSKMSLGMSNEIRYNIYDGRKYEYYNKSQYLNTLFNMSSSDCFFAAWSTRKEGYYVSFQKIS